ncbi:flippase [Candidatus Kaiserbacteria bacterium]|nr:MAG: flippase [Candidatus Kaiserbacteria bacterium]
MKNLLKTKMPFSFYGLRRYAGSAGWSLFGKLITMSIGLFATLYIARALGPTNFGELSYALSFIALFSFIASLGIDNVLYRELVKNPGQKNFLLGSALVIKLTTGSGAAVLAILTAWILSSPDVSLLLIALLSITFISQSVFFISYEFGAAVKARAVALLSIFVVIVINFLKIGAIYLGGGVIYLAIILVFESLLYAIGYIFIRQRTFGTLREWKFDLSTTKGLLIDSWPYMFITAFALIYSRVDQVLLKNLIDSTEVGLYDAAVRLSELWYFIPTLLAGSLLPALINAKQHSLEDYIHRFILLILLSFGLAVSIAIGVYLLAPTIVHVIYGPDFVGTAGILRIYIWALIPMSLIIVINQFFLAENERFMIFVSAFSGMFINIVANIWLIPLYQGIGAAIATLISSCVMVAVSTLLYVVYKRLS